MVSMFIQPKDMIAKWSGNSKTVHMSINVSEINQVVVVHTLNSHTGEAEAGGSL